MYYKRDENTFILEDISEVEAVERHNQTRRFSRGIARRLMIINWAIFVSLLLIVYTYYSRLQYIVLNTEERVVTSYHKNK